METQESYAISKQLEQAHNSLQDLSDAVLTLAIVQAMSGGVLSAAAAHQAVLEIFEAVSMGGKDHDGDESRV